MKRKVFVCLFVFILQPSILYNEFEHQNLNPHTLSIGHIGCEKTLFQILSPSPFGNRKFSFSHNWHYSLLHRAKVLQTNTASKYFSTNKIKTTKGGGNPKLSLLTCQGREPVKKLTEQFPEGEKKWLLFFSKHLELYKFNFNFPNAGASIYVNGRADSI